jgi:hypothetical protein
MCTGYDLVSTQPSIVISTSTPDDVAVNTALPIIGLAALEPPAPAVLLPAAPPAPPPP